jgi:hypothetical protein
LKANVTALDIYLRHGPTKTIRSRIKRLRGMGRPQYRLRVDDVRVFYDVSNSTVEIFTPAMAAGVTPKLWEMADIVAVLEDWEAANF